MENKEYLGKIFRTEKEVYFYDSGTGKVLSCDDKEEEILNQILGGQKSIQKACEENLEFARVIHAEKLLACPQHREFEVIGREEYNKVVPHTCKQIILELTEACNLRCGYCIYNEHHSDYRAFSQKNMSEEIAKKSIDMILSEVEGDEFALTFYGGEPLVNFSLMRSCIDYVKGMHPDLKLSVSFTSNLTLLTEEMIDYFANLKTESVDIMCSLDGPQNLHDKYRKFANGVGSYRAATKHFKLLLSRFYDLEKKHTLSINCVVAPAYSKMKLLGIKKYFEEELGIPKEIEVHYAYMDRGGMEIPLNKEGIVEDATKMESDVPMEEWAQEEILSGNRDKKLFDIFAKEMWMMASREKAKNGEVLTRSGLLGCCIPGQRRIYVTVDGDFKVCERIGKSPSLGNYKDGINTDGVVQNYFIDFSQKMQNRCDHCWARNLCTMCYEEMIDENGLTDRIDDLCNGSRSFTENLLRNYYQFLEKDPHYLEDMLKQYSFG